MTETIPVPVWVFLVLAVLGTAWQIAGAMRDHAMKELMRLYLEHTNKS